MIASLWSQLLAALIKGAAYAAAALGIYEAGKTKQQNSDLKAANAQDVQARKIDDAPVDVAARDAYLAERMHRTYDGE